MSNHTPSLTELEMRVAKLERQNRRLTSLGALCLLMAASGFVLIQAPRDGLNAAPSAASPVASYDTLSVRRLELRDRGGMLRGTWTVDDKGPDLALHDSAGKRRVGLGLEADVPIFALCDAAGNSRAGLSVQAAGPILVLSDGAGKIRAALGMAAKGPGLALYDAAGRTRAALRATPEGSGLALHDAAVILFGKDGRVIWRAP